MKKTPIQILRDLVDVHSVATELVYDNRYEELAAEYISHDAPTMPELREKVMDQAKRVLEDAEPNLAPRWEDAPHWAGWLAQDYNAEWYWYESKPKESPHGGGWISSCGDRTMRAKKPASKASNCVWRDTLQVRP